MSSSGPLSSDDIVSLETTPSHLSFCSRVSLEFFTRAEERSFLFYITKIDRVPCVSGGGGGMEEEGLTLQNWAHARIEHVQ